MILKRIPVVHQIEDVHLLMKLTEFSLRGTAKPFFLVPKENSKPLSMIIHQEPQQCDYALSKKHFPLNDLYDKQTDKLHVFLIQPRSLGQFSFVARFKRSGGFFSSRFSFGVDQTWVDHRLDDIYESQ